MQIQKVAHRFRTLLTAPLVLVITLFCTSAFGAVISFSGEDLNAGPGGPFTSSNAAAASFTTAAQTIGNVGIIKFESASLGAFTSLAIAPGVTASGPSGLSINNTPALPSGPALDGFNTTPGGANYLEDQAGTLTFTFASPVQFFGAYLTGLQIYYAQDVITFSDGTSETINAVETGTGSGSGAVNFLGFTDAGKPISSVSIVTNGGGGGTDYIGVDDVRYQTTAVPEPASAGLVLAASFGIFLVYRRNAFKSRKRSISEAFCAARATAISSSVPHLSFSPPTNPHSERAIPVESAGATTRPTSASRTSRDIAL